MVAVKVVETTISARVAAHTRRFRKARGWSQEDMVERMRKHGLETSVSGLSKMETGGRRLISVDEAVALAEVFVITLDDLINWRCSTCGGNPPAGFTCNDCGEVK